MKNSLINKVKRIIVNPRRIMMYIRYSLEKKGLLDRLSDETYLKFTYWTILGKRLNLDNPRAFNEKLQWLKLNNRNSDYVKMVDKIEVKSFVAALIGEEHIIPTLGVWHRPEEIDFDMLPNQFVLKCNHNSGTGMYICKDKSTINKEKVFNELKRGLRQDYYMHVREWPYKNVERRIIAEKYMSDSNERDLKDYKVFTFNGHAHFIQVDYNRFTDHHRNFYSREWEYVPFTTCYPTNPQHQIERPKCLTELLNYAEILAHGAGDPPFLRVDFYIIKDQIYFGEMTFYHGSGMEKFYPPEYDEKLGKLIDIDL